MWRRALPLRRLDVAQAHHVGRGRLAGVGDHARHRAAELGHQERLAQDGVFAGDAGRGIAGRSGLRWRSARATPTPSRLPAMTMSVITRSKGSASTAPKAAASSVTKVTE